MQMFIVLAFTNIQITSGTLASISNDGYRTVDFLLMQMLVLGQINHAFTSTSYIDENCDSTETP